MTQFRSVSIRNATSGSWLLTRLSTLGSPQGDVRIWNKARLVGAAAIGAMTGIGLGMLIADGDWVAAAVAVVAAAVLRLLLRRIAAEEHKAALEWLVALSFAGHLALMSLIHYRSVAVGSGGFVTGDDSDYADLSRRLALWLHGEPVDIGWSAESYLFGNFLWLETAVFYVFGPQVLIFKVLNVAFMSSAIVFLFDLARRIFSRSAAMVSSVLVAMYPSVTLWSVLNLKDSLALMLIAIALWSIARFRDAPAWRWLVLSFGVIAIVESVRQYVFLVLAPLVPISVVVALARTVSWRRAMPYLTASVIASVLLVAHSRGVGLGPLGAGMLAVLEEKRAWMAVGARTSIDQDAGRSVVAKPGDAFIVVSGVATPTPGAALVTAAGPTPAPSSGPVVGPVTPRPSASVTPAPTPRVVVVDPLAKLILTTPDQAASTAEPSLAPNEVAVRPGDIVVVAGLPLSTAAPVPILVGDKQRPAPQLQTTDSLEAAPVLVRTIRYLPQGMAYALFAPFPWAATTRADLVAIPEMLLWYLLLALGVAALWLHRESWRRWLMLFLYVAALFTVLALGEGNVGTIFRHRMMVIPIVVVFSGPVFLRLWHARTHPKDFNVGLRTHHVPASETAP